MIIVASLIALVEMSEGRGARSSPLTNVTGDVASLFALTTGTIAAEVRNELQAVARMPQLSRENAALRVRNRKLAQENSALRELLPTYTAQHILDSILSEYPHAIPARVIGFTPENELHVVTIDRGTNASVSRDDGVLNGDGVVGRILEATRFTGKVLLITDFTSTIPAVVQRGRWWGIAKGNLTSLHLEYISQDARLRIGDRVVTGEARSFHSGALIGRIVKIERTDAGLYQTAIVQPAVEFGSLDRVNVVPK